MRREFLPAALFILLYFLANCCYAQNSLSADTVSYTLDHYSVKKAASTWALSKKIKVDAALLARLNQLSDLDAAIPAGTSLVIPVYGKPGKKAKNVAAVPADTAVKSADTIKNIQPAVNVELEQNRLLLVDATLDLNQTLLQGVQASIDSLNVEDRPVDDKDVQGKLHQMERQRDRILIKPYLTHIKDSLNAEIANEKKEKLVIETSLGIKTAAEAVTTLPAAENTKPVVAHVTPVVTPVENKSEAVKMDTAPNVAEPKKPEPIAAENTTAPVIADKAERPAVLKQDTAAGKPIVATEAQGVRPVVEVNPNAAPVKKHYESAKALPSLAENFFLQGMRDIPAITENTPAPATRDTQAYISQFKPRAKTSVVGAASRNTSDSIELLKAELLVTRATAAMNERNNALAEDYLKKAVDIDPSYYNAWFALADLHLQQAYPAKALGEFKICEKLDSSNAKLYYKMGSAAFRSAQKDEAYKYFQKSLQIDNAYAPAIMGLGQTLSERKEYAPAIAEFGRVLALNKGFHSAYKSRGIAEYMSGSFAAAIDDFTTYLLFEDRDGASYYYRGMSEIADQNVTDGCPDLKTALHYKYTTAQKAYDNNCSK
jgi:tetratricopeptide (TPR) repeat protein